MVREGMTMRLISTLIQSVLCVVGTPHGQLPPRQAAVDAAPEVTGSCPAALTKPVGWPPARPVGSPGSKEPARSTPPLDRRAALAAIDVFGPALACS
jgi:hypothetical protein